MPRKGAALAERGPLSVPSRAPRTQVGLPKQSAASSASETASDQERSLHLRPAGITKRREHLAEPIASREREVIKVQSARGWHPVVGCEHHLGDQATDRARSGDHDNLAKGINDGVSCEKKNGTTLVWIRKRVLTNLTAAH
jgi:hypothetical protein